MISIFIALCFSAGVLFYFLRYEYLENKRRKDMRKRHEEIKKRLADKRKAERLARIITPIEWYN